jgi:DNA-binding transcriptional ArsR family regulator
MNLNSFTQLGESAGLNRAGVTRLLTAIGDPARLEIVFLLGDGRRQTVGEIAGNFRLSRPAISHHLKILREAGVVSNEKVGQEVYYWLNTMRMVGALRALADEVENCLLGEQGGSSPSG